MASVGVVVSWASRMRTKLQSALEAIVLEIEEVSHQHASHEAMRDKDTKAAHFNVRIVSPKFQGQTLVKRHRKIYDALSNELHSGLHALSIVAKTPDEFS